MGNLMGFDPDQVEGELSYEAIPAGNYEAVLCESENKTSESTGCEYIQLVWEVIEGEYRGRKIYDISVRRHSNETAVAFGNRKLKAIMGVLGKVNDTSEWHNRPIGIKVKVKFNKERGGNQNQIGDYFNIDAESPPKVSPKHQTAKVSPIGEKKKAWAR